MTVNSEYLNAMAAANRAAMAEKAASDPTALSSEYEAAAARAKAAEDKARADPTIGNRYVALVASAEAAKAKAAATLAAVMRSAEEHEREAVRKAGDDPVARARAKADAISARATGLGEAEVAYEDASLAYDKAVVETARAGKEWEWKINASKARVAAAEEKAKNDPMRIGNPYYQAPPTLAQWQFDALDEATKLRALKDGAVIVDETAPPFTADEARSVLRMRGSASRRVMTRSELSALPPDEQRRAAMSSILIDD